MESIQQTLTEVLDREILHSETRIKFWVVAGVLANLVMLIGIGAPLIYYLGTIQAQATSVLATIQETSGKLDAIEIRINAQDRRIDSAETWMEGKGYQAPIRNQRSPS